MDRSTPGFPVLHCLMEVAQILSIESVRSSNHLIICCPLHLPSISFAASGSFPICQAYRGFFFFFLFLKKCTKIFFFSQKCKIRYGCKSFVGYCYQNLLIPSFYHLLIQHYFLGACLLCDRDRFRLWEHNSEGEERKRKINPSLL